MKEKYVIYRIVYLIHVAGGMNMILKFDGTGNILIVKMSGELDHHSSETARIKIDNKLEEMQSTNIIFDFSEVNFMDSSGIGVVIGRYKKVAQYGGKAAVVGMTPKIKKVFEMAGLFKIVNEYSSVSQAVLKL